MTDPVTGAALVAAGTYLAKKGLGRVLGPASEEVGAALGRYTKRQLQNVGRVVENANKKTMSANSGSTPLRVAMHVLEEGARSEDQIVVEYLGGILASSRTPIGRDDRGVAFSALISRMSTYALRTHYALYSEMHRCLDGAEVNFLNEAERKDASFYAPYASLASAMDLDLDDDNEPTVAIIYNTTSQLTREELLRLPVGGQAKHIAERFVVAPTREAGIIAQPTVSGIELFLWGLGLGNLLVNQFPTISFPAIEGLEFSPFIEQVREVSWQEELQRLREIRPE